VPIENALTDRTPPDTGQPPLLSHPNIPPGSNVGNPPAGGTVEDYLRNYYSNSGSGTGKTIDELLRQYYGNGGGNNGGVDTTGLLLGLGGSLISALGAVRPQQRQSFQGTKADPINILSGAQQAIGGEAPLLFDRAKQGGELTAPMPGHLPTFTGGGMPMPVGVTPPSSGVPPLGLRRNTGQASTQPASQDELDHLYSSLSLIGGRR
jgi:hypothetical protein